jgi:hypothetical protein
VERCCSPAGESPAREVGLFHPVAVEADEEVTNRLKPLMTTGRLGRLSKQAGRNKCERRAGLETKLADADPAVQGGRPPSWSPEPPRLGENKAEQPRASRVRRGRSDGMCARRADATRAEGDQGGSPRDPVRRQEPQLKAREGQVRPGWESDRPIVPRKRVTTVEGRGRS